MNSLRTLRDSVFEVFGIARAAVSNFWFWVPILYSVYFIVQLWLIFFVHPLTVFIAAVFLGLYGIRLEDKRVSSRYSLKKTKRLLPTHVLDEGPQPIETLETEVSRTVNEYEGLLEKREKKQ
jgi:hypothetical protein